MYEIRIGNVLKRQLREQRKTLKEVSRDTGIPYSTLHTWNLNRQPKDILKAKRLAEYFKLTLHELIFDRMDPRQTEFEPPISGIQSVHEIPSGTYEITMRKIR